MIVTHAQQNNFPELTGAYIGQKRPGLTPEIFAQGIVSTDNNEFNALFTPDGKQLFITQTKDKKQSIVFYEERDGKWGERQMFPFSGKYRDVDPYISPDGKRIYFSSTRPLRIGEEKTDCDFWYSEKDVTGEWSEPKHLNYPASEDKDDFYITLTEKGIMYYSIFADGSGNIYRIVKNNSVYLQPEKLEFDISTKYNDHDPFIAPDENYLIFSSDRPGGYGSNDLYISFRKSDGTWSNPMNMGKEINSDKYDFCSILSPDGGYLFFSSSRTGNGDIYWVDAKIIEDLRKESLKDDK